MADQTQTTDWRAVSREELWAILDAHKDSPVSQACIDWARSVIASGEIQRALQGRFKTMAQFKAEMEARRAGR